MLINQEDVKQTKEHIEVMEAFINGKEIEFKPDSFKGIWKQTTAPTWDFSKYKYRIKPEAQKFKYPIYKKSKYGIVIKFTGLNSGTYVKKTISYNIGYEADDFVEHTCKEYWDDYDPETDSEFEYPIYRESKDFGTIVKFTGLATGEYMTKTSSFNIGDTNENFVEHTDNTFWKDYDPSIDMSSEPEVAETIELFEVMVWCDILKEFGLKNILYSYEDLENYNVTKTGRSFVIDKETKKLIKVNNN